MGYLVKLPEGVAIVDFKWVCKIKWNPSSNVEWYEARLITKEFTQKECIVYHETFSSVSKKVFVEDVKINFLNKDLDEVIYMKHLGNFGDNSQKACKLKNSIYQQK